MKIILTSDPKFKADYSIEAGHHDGKKHFDHHGKYAGEPAPCNRLDMPYPGPFDTVQISHMDADTFIGLLRMSGNKLPGLDFNLMEQIDLNGSSVCNGRYHPTLLYMVGIGEISKSLKFPRVTAEHQDVTDIVEKMMRYQVDYILDIGQVATGKAEKAYADCLIKNFSDCIGVWSIGPNDPLDPSRAYDDFYIAVVVYRKHYKSVSVYCSPKNDYTISSFGTIEDIDLTNYQATIGSYRMCGHPKAAGTERTDDGWTEGDALKIFEEIRKKL